jgi:hypothetical protein
MWCMKCNRDLMDCVCPDLEERLDNLWGIALTFCVDCGKTIYLCKCKKRTGTVQKVQE